MDRSNEKTKRPFLGIFSQHEGYGMCAFSSFFVLHVMSAERERDTVYVSDIITFLRENYRLVITYA